ncbi:hypothetical protein AB6D73_17095 [Vibrio splendidus]
MINNNDFEQLNNLVINKYKFLYSNYPHTFSIFETMIRTHEFQRYAQLENQKIVYFSKEKSKAFRVMRFAIEVQNFLLKKNKKPSVYIELRRFELLSELIDSELKNNKIETKVVKNYNSSIYKIKDLLIFRYNDFKSTLLRDKTFDNIDYIFKSITNQSGFEKNIPLFDKIESLLLKEVKAAKKWLTVMQVTHLVLLEDHEPRTRVLLSASKELNIPSFTFCHGYIQDPSFITILPINCTRLYVWDESQRNTILSKGVKKEKVEVFTFPKIFDLKNIESASQNILIVCEPFFDNPYIDGKIFDYLEEIIVFSSKIEDVTVRIRPHPKEMNNDLLTKYFLNLNVEISNESLKDDFQKSSLVLGSNSSTLLESYHSGLETFQFEEFHRNDFPKIKKLNIDQVKDKIANIKSVKRNRASNDIKISLENKVKEFVSDNILW